MDKHAELPRMKHDQDTESRDKAQAALKGYLEETNTVISLVFGDDTNASMALVIAKKVSVGEAMDQTRVINIPDPRVLTTQQSNDWIQVGVIHVLLTMTRTVHKKLAWPDAGSFGTVTEAVVDALGAD